MLGGFGDVFAHIFEFWGSFWEEETQRNANGTPKKKQRNKKEIQRRTKNWTPHWHSLLDLKYSLLLLSSLSLTRSFYKAHFPFPYTAHSRNTPKATPKLIFGPLLASTCSIWASFWWRKSLSDGPEYQNASIARIEWILTVFSPKSTFDVSGLWPDMNNETRATSTGHLSFDLGHHGGPIWGARGP